MSSDHFWLCKCQNRLNFKINSFAVVNRYLHYSLSDIMLLHLNLYTNLESQWNSYFWILPLDIKWLFSNVIFLSGNLPYVLIKIAKYIHLPSPMLSHLPSPMLSCALINTENKKVWITKHFNAWYHVWLSLLLLQFASM